MGGEWATKRLGEVAGINPDTIVRDWPHPHIRYIDISSVGVGQIEVPPQWMRLSDAPSRAKRLVCRGDTVLSTARPNRRSMFFASQPGDDWVVSTGFAVLRPNIQLVDPRFLYACVFNQAFTEYLITREQGAAYPAVSAEDIGNAEIPFPPLKEQQAISCILGALDDKIELNRRMNRTLEEMARAIFKSWFVDFDPVRAKAAARREHPHWTEEEVSRAACPNLKPEIAVLFPDSFEDSDLGEIPKGWVVGTIKDCCSQIQNGGTPRRNEPRFWNDGDISWLTSGEVRQPIITATENFITEAGYKESSAKWVSPISTVIALYGATAGQVSLVSFKLTTNQAVCALVPKKFCAFFNYLWMRTATSELESKAVGSAQQNISKGIVEETRVVRPPCDVLERFTKLVGPLFNRWIVNLHESRTLAAQRDALLPKLISGELRVPDAERIAGRCL